jgi:hypothetical protein
MLEESAFITAYNRLPDMNQLLIRNVAKIHLLGKIGFFALKQIHVIEGDQAADLRRNGPMLIAHRNLRVLVVWLIKLLGS